MLLYGASEEVAAWVSFQLFGNYRSFKGSEAIGVVKDGKLICGVIYEDFVYTPEGKCFACEMSIASIDKTWAKRHYLKAFFSYPFIQLDLERVLTQCSKNEGDIMNFNKRLGFKKEGVHRGAWPCGGDSISFGMLKGECKWL